METAETQPTAPPVALFKKRGARGKENLRKRPATPPPAAAASDSDSDDDDDYSSAEDEAGQRIKRRKKNTGTVTASSRTQGGGSSAAAADLSATVFKADRSVPISSSNDATRQSNWHEEADEDLSARNLLGTTRKNKTQGGGAGAGDGTYKGLANQTSFIQRNPDAPNRKVGPIKAATNIRTITVTDYAPDVCKDYKLTGFCGFGDNCKYLHERESYLAGWQLDREWENVTRGKKNLGGTVVASAADRTRTTGGGNADDADQQQDADEAALLETIPFACIICKGPYREPVVTRCGHYFCEPCALQRYRKDPSCAACGAGTGGVFNAAKRLKKLLEKKRERERRRREEAIAAGEEVSDEEQEDEDGD